MSSRKGRKHLEKQFIDAAIESNLPKLKKCIANGVNPNALSKIHEAALHIAAEKGDLVIGKELLNLPKIDLNIRTSIGHTPLTLACTLYKDKFVKLLLHKKADPNIPNRNGQTILHIAALHRNFRLLPEIIRYGGKVNVSDVFGNTPLSMALIDAPNYNSASILLKKGANIHYECENRIMHLFLELVLNVNSEEQMEILEMIVIFTDLDVNSIVDEITGRNCLHLVACSGYRPLAEYLLNKGAQHFKDKSNRIPIEIAFDHENFEIADVFFNHHAKLTPDE